MKQSSTIPNKGKRKIREMKRKIFEKNGRYRKKVSVTENRRKMEMEVLSETRGDRRIWKHCRKYGGSGAGVLFECGPYFFIYFILLFSQVLAIGSVFGRENFVGDCP